MTYHQTGYANDKFPERQKHRYHLVDSVSDYGGLMHG